MENNNQVKKLCKIRDLYRSIFEFETSFQAKYNLCLNEGMLLCSLREKEHTSTELANLLGLTTSNTSKVIKLVETKGLVERQIGKKDKRQMYFTLTEEGIEKLKAIRCSEVEVPSLLRDALVF